MKKNMISIGSILASLAIALTVALAGSQGGIVIGELPLFIVCALFAFSIQWAAFIPAFIYQTETYFDLFGSLTYISLAVLALVFSTMEPGTIAIALMVIVWAGRLGGFLFSRVKRVGHDTRFRSIKPDFLQFLMTWTIQGLWVFLTFAAGLAAMTTDRAHPIDAFVAIGCLVWFTGFLIEVIADNQKTNFRKDDGKQGKFIRHGLWALSRHPNYFGEILLWTGIAIAALPALEGWQHLTLISPIFVFVLLTKISGVRMLEHQAKRRWGGDAEYIEYHRRTPMLLPNPFLAGDKS
jgi:steroid 5-alpha reductase family enzyme